VVANWQIKFKPSQNIRNNKKLIKKYPFDALPEISMYFVKHSEIVSMAKLLITKLMKMI